ncbi:MAG: flagellar biosynthesis anti-sigma factor FlgM [Zoogloeaceae bacterium]|jgi:negative regulator of flagellin synthesis FlgM|nr:flagellar biosynthesis anti-sigma factor FlgM [Zoogloeaceae bacterium]
MKIDSTYNLTLTPAPSAHTPAKPAAKNAAGEQVQLSDAAQFMASDAPVDSNRVQEIKQAIAEGRFRINPEAIADRLINTAQELIEAQRRV